MQLTKTPQINAAIAGRLNALGKDGSIHSINDELSAVKILAKNRQKRSNVYPVYSGTGAGFHQFFRHTCTEKSSSTG